MAAGEGLSAFISYRRRDVYDPVSSTAETDKEAVRALAEKIRSILEGLGFEEVFLDTDTMQFGDHYEAKIHSAIKNCDLFVPLIGRAWLEICEQRAVNGEDDFVLREIHAAVRYEKEIVPILVAGARMPEPSDLPEEIRTLHFKHALSISPEDTNESVSRLLSNKVESLSARQRLGRRWTYGYALLALAIYYFAAFEPNRVGLDEYGADAWIGMATRWSGLFVWPLVFLPFALVALYRPMQILIEGVMNATRLSDVLSNLTPLIFGCIIAGLGLSLEIYSPEQVPWTVHPVFAMESGALDCGPSRVGSYANAELKAVVAYGSGGDLQSRQEAPFWLTNKCWPNALFYLTDERLVISDAYRRERPKVHQAFMRVLNTKHLEQNGVPYSRTFWAYLVSFSILALLGAVGAAMAAFFVVASIRGRDQYVEYRLPSEDAYLSLTYAFVSLMFWVPFRMVTNYTKKRYYCADVEACALDPSVFLTDFVIGSIFFIGYACMAIGLIVKHRRVALGLLSAVSVSAIVALSYLVYTYGDRISALAGDWRLYVAVSIPSIMLLLLLGYQFHPAIVRFNDFKKEFRGRLGGRWR